MGLVPHLDETLPYIIFLVLWVAFAYIFFIVCPCMDCLQDEDPYV